MFLYLFQTELLECGHHVVRSHVIVLGTSDAPPILITVSFTFLRDIYDVALNSLNVVALNHRILSVLSWQRNLDVVLVRLIQLIAIGWQSHSSQAKGGSPAYL